MNMYINIKEEHITRKEKPKDLNSKEGKLSYLKSANAIICMLLSLDILIKDNMLRRSTRSGWHGLIHRRWNLNIGHKAPTILNILLPL